MDTDNELVFDYLKDKSIKNWADKLLYYNSFQLILERDYQITAIEGQFAKNDPDFSEFLRDIFRISMMTHKKRLPLTIEHDVNMIGYMYNFKNKEPVKMFDSPWVVTLDDLLIYISGYIMRNRGTSCEYCIHAQKWFNLLIPFCDIEDIKTNQRNFVNAILKYSIIPFNFKLSLEEYTKLLANKFGLEGADSSMILKIISKSRRQHQLEASLEKNNIRNVKDITYEIFNDDNLIDELLEKKEDEKTIERLRESIRRSREESETMKIQRDLYKELLFTRPNMEEIYKKIEEIQTDISRIDPEFFNKFDLERLDKNPSETNATNYLEKLSGFIERRSKDVKNLSQIYPRVIVLFEFLKGFLGP